MKNRGSTPILTNLVGVHLRNYPDKIICAEVQEKKSTMRYYIVTYSNTSFKYTSYVIPRSSLA